MYIPRHLHYAISLSISLLGFYIKQKFGNTYDVVIVFLVLQYHAIMHTAYITIAGQMYQAYVTDWKAKQVPEDEPVYNHHTGNKVEPLPPATSDGFIPLARKPVATVPVYNQVVSLPRFDKERNFAVTLIRMCELDPEKVDLTEAKWVSLTKKFVRSEFVAMLDNWRSHEIIARKSNKKNSPYIVVRWEAVRLIANGNHLPPPPPK